MKKFLLLTSLVCSITMLQAQRLDTAFVATAETNAKKLLSQTLGMQSHLYNGPAYVEPRMTSDEQFPYYQSIDWLYGDIIYDGEKFENIPLLYSTYTDQLITELPNGQRIQLLKPKITYFTINGKLFVPLTNPSLRSGFYAHLHKGKTPVYARYEKRFQERISGQIIEIDYEEKVRFYIVKNGVFLPVKSKSDVLSVLSDRKREIKQFISKNHLSIRRNPETSIVTIADFYDSL